MIWYTKFQMSHLYIFTDYFMTIQQQHWRHRRWTDRGLFSLLHDIEMNSNNISIVNLNILSSWSVLKTLSLNGNQITELPVSYDIGNSAVLRIPV